MTWTQALVVWIFFSSYAAVESGKPVLYYFLPSPPSRTVLMTAKVLGSDLDMKVLDVSKGEQFTPAFLTINPQHTVPALDDNGLTLSESRAIAAYLAHMSPKGNQLYPKDPKKRAVIDQMMDFDLGRLYSRVINFFTFDADATPMVVGAPFDQKKSDLLDGAFAMLEEYLTRNSWVAGSSMSIADISILTSVSMAEGCGYNLSKFPKTNQWLAKMKTAIPEYKALNEDGLNMLLNASKALINKDTKQSY